MTEGFELEELNYIFCSDEYLHQMNLTYLNHDTLTDIITFDNSEAEQIIEGDIFISIDRVKENSEEFDVLFETELHRVLVHGLLHLFGYKDKSEREKVLMREKEEACLSLLSI
jgi:probable rRNA maturation factor